MKRCDVCLREVDRLEPILFAFVSTEFRDACDECDKAMSAALVKADAKIAPIRLKMRRDAFDEAVWAIRAKGK